MTPVHFTTEDATPLTRQELTAVAVFVVVQRGPQPGQAFKQTLTDVHSLTRPQLIDLVFAERLDASTIFALTFMAGSFRPKRFRRKGRRPR